MDYSPEGGGWLGTSSGDSNAEKSGLHSDSESVWGVQAIGSLPARTHHPEVENRLSSSHKTTGVCFLLASWGDLHTPLLSTWFRQDPRVVSSELKM